LFAFFAATTATATAQRVLRVPSQYATIQAAIAATGVGDTVLVDPGIYREAVSFPSFDITLRGTGGAMHTVIQGDGQGASVSISSAALTSRCVLEGFTITGGKPGISIFGSPTIVNNVVAGNGGGIQVSLISSPSLMNNSICANTAGAGGGISLGGLYSQVTVTNCILWRNQVQAGPEISVSSGGTATVTYSNVTGGWPGTGNLDVDPRFIDSVNHDFHLMAHSALIGKGASAAPGQPLTDFEGDPRPRFGSVDIGADQFHRHVYAAGSPTPGGLVHALVLGPPGSAVIWGGSGSVLQSPLTLPGIGGALWLHPVGLFLLPLPPTSTSGISSFSVRLPTSIPPVTLHMQALVKSDLTNSFRLEIGSP